MCMKEIVQQWPGAGMEEDEQPLFPGPGCGQPHRACRWAAAQLAPPPKGQQALGVGPSGISHPAPAHTCKHGVGRVTGTQDTGARLHVGKL